MEQPLFTNHRDQHIFQVPESAFLSWVRSHPQLRIVSTYTKNTRSSNLLIIIAEGTIKTD